MNYAELAKKLYPEFKTYAYNSYWPIITAFGEPLVVVTEPGYSGDTFIFYADAIDSVRLEDSLFRTPEEIHKWVDEQVKKLEKGDE